MRTRVGVVGLALGSVVMDCRPSDVLSVPAPNGVVTSGELQNQAGAEGAFNAAKGQLFTAIGGSSNIIQLGGWLTDEFTYSGFVGGYGIFAGADARMTAANGGIVETGDLAWEHLLRARLRLLSTISVLARYEPTSGRSKIGEAYALAAYGELMVAETYCAGTPLSEVLPGGVIKYGMPLTADSLLGVAQAHFDSGLAAADGNDTIAALASVGLGRTLLDRGRYAAAATAVQNVPSSFIYNIELEPGGFSNGLPYSFSLYDYGVQNTVGRIFNVADHEGENGLNFVSARDPRLLLDSTLGATYDGTSAWYMPTKFEANFSYIPLTTGIEAQLIAAEAALKAGQIPTWLADLNTLRNSGCSTSGPDTTCSVGSGQVVGQIAGLPPVTDPGTDSGRVSLLFRERAFWLFGTGVRLGDLRRLIRQYGRNESAVFPTGPYVNGNSPHLPVPIPVYGTDVNLTLPTPSGMSYYGMSETNPNYKGCISSTKTA